jgi:WD40 repeat protein
MQDEIVYTQSSQLPESMQQEVDSALALCRATLERCTAQHAAIGGASENHRVLPTKAHRDHAGTNNHDYYTAAPQRSDGSEGAQYSRGLDATWAPGGPRSRRILEEGSTLSVGNGQQAGRDTKRAGISDRTVLLTRHCGTVRDIAVPSTVRLVASASGDHVVHISRPTEAGATSTPEDSSGSPGTGSSNGAGPVAVLRGHKHIVSGVAFSPDGRYLVSASFDKTLRVWLRPERTTLEDGHSAGNDPASGGGGTKDGKGVQAAEWRPIAVLQGHTDAISCVRWRPCRTIRSANIGRRSDNIGRAQSERRGEWCLLSGSADCNVALWHVALAGVRPSSSAWEDGCDDSWDALPTVHVAAGWSGQGGKGGGGGREGGSGGATRVRVTEDVVRVTEDVVRVTEDVVRVTEDVVSGRCCSPPHGAAAGGGDGGDGEAQWRVTCRVQWVGGCHERGVSCLEWAGDGGKFVSGGVDGSLAVFCTESGRKGEEEEEEEAAAAAVAGAVLWRKCRRVGCLWSV